MLTAITCNTVFMVVIMQAGDIIVGKSVPRTSEITGDREIWVTPYEKRLLTGKPQTDGDNANPSPSDRSMPLNLPDDWVYDNIKDAIYHCRRIFYIYLGILCYTLLTISTSPALDFFKEQKIIMPFMDARMSLNYYLGLAPLLLVGFFVYKQLYLYKTNKLIKYAIDECKDLNKDNCSACNDKAKKCTLNSMCDRHLSRLYPWIIIYCRFLENGTGVEAGKDRLGATVGKAQKLFVSFSLWWLLPIILLLLSGFVIKKHSIVLTTYMLCVTCLGISVVAFFWYLQQSLMNRTGTRLSSICALSIFSATAIFVMLLIRLNMIAFIGKMPWQDSIWSEEKKTPLKVLAVRHFVFADLNHQAISKKPENELAYWIDLEKRHFEGANLSRAKLNKANLKFSRLNNASFEQAYLEEADLREAKANGADFSGAILTKATLASSELEKADFSNANLQEAIFTGATLDKADFRFADLSGANLSSSQIKHADFSNANIQNALLFGVLEMQADQIKRANNYQLAFYTQDWLEKLKLPHDNNARVERKRFSDYRFEDAILADADLYRADLTGARLRNANLRRANLQDATLHDALLFNADFQEANLKGVAFTNIEQFSVVKSLYKAKLDPSLKAELEKRYPHLFVNPFLK